MDPLENTYVAAPVTIHIRNLLLTELPCLGQPARRSTRIRSHDSFPRFIPVLRVLELLVTLQAVLRGALVEERRVDLHEELQDVVAEPVDRSVPMLLRVDVQRSKHNREECGTILIDEIDDLVVVPDEQRAFRDLEVRALHTLRDARKELHGNSFELRRLNVLQDLLGPR